MKNKKWKIRLRLAVIIILVAIFGATSFSIFNGEALNEVNSQLSIKNIMNIKVFPFNPLEVNCYVCYDETNACVIIDPSCSNESEYARLCEFIKKQNLTPKHIILTHPHFDHLLGSARLCETFNLPLTLHKSGLSLFGMAVQQAEYLNVAIDRLPQNHTYVDEGDTITFGRSELKILYTPGHADGSICLVDYSGKTVFTGDVLFHSSIGRTDLMTGNFDVLKKNIYEKLFVLGDDFTVRPGHGGRTEIGFERFNNPFF